MSRTQPPKGQVMGQLEKEEQANKAHELWTNFFTKSLNTTYAKRNEGTGSEISEIISPLVGTFIGLGIPKQKEWSDVQIQSLMQQIKGFLEPLVPLETIRYNKLDRDQLKETAGVKTGVICTRENVICAFMPTDLYNDDVKCAVSILANRLWELSLHFNAKKIDEQMKKEHKSQECLYQEKIVEMARTLAIFRPYKKYTLAFPMCEERIDQRNLVDSFPKPILSSIDTNSKLTLLPLSVCKRMMKDALSKILPYYGQGQEYFSFFTDDLQMANFFFTYECFAKQANGLNLMDGHPDDEEYRIFQEMQEMFVSLAVSYLEKIEVARMQCGLLKSSIALAISKEFEIGVKFQHVRNILDGEKARREAGAQGGMLLYYNVKEKGPVSPINTKPRYSFDRLLPAFQEVFISCTSDVPSEQSKQARMKLSQALPLSQFYDEDERVLYAKEDSDAVKSILQWGNKFAQVQDQISNWGELREYYLLRALININIAASAAVPNYFASLRGEQAKPECSLPDGAILIPEDQLQKMVKRSEILKKKIVQKNGTLILGVLEKFSKMTPNTYLPRKYIDLIGVKNILFNFLMQTPNFKISENGKEAQPITTNLEVWLRRRFPETMRAYAEYRDVENLIFSASCEGKVRVIHEGINESKKLYMDNLMEFWCEKYLLVNISRIGKNLRPVQPGYFMDSSNAMVDVKRCYESFTGSQNAPYNQQTDNNKLCQGMSSQKKTKEMIPALAELNGTYLPLLENTEKKTERIVVKCDQIMNAENSNSRNSSPCASSAKDLLQRFSANESQSEGEGTSEFEQNDLKEKAREAEMQEKARNEALDTKKMGEAQKTEKDKKVQDFLKEKGCTLIYLLEEEKNVETILKGKRAENKVPKEANEAQIILETINSDKISKLQFMGYPVQYVLDIKKPMAFGVILHNQFLVIGLGKYIGNVPGEFAITHSFIEGLNTGSVLNLTDNQELAANYLTDFPAWEAARDAQKPTVAPKQATTMVELTKTETDTKNTPKKEATTKKQASPQEENEKKGTPDKGQEEKMSSGRGKK